MSWDDSVFQVRHVRVPLLSTSYNANRTIKEIRIQFPVSGKE